MNPKPNLPHRLTKHCILHCRQRGLFSALCLQFLNESWTSQTAIFISQGVQQRHVHRSSCHISPHLEQWCFVILIVRHSVCIWMLQSKAYLHVFLCLCQIFCSSDIQKAFWKRLLFWSWDIVLWECNPVPLYQKYQILYMRAHSIFWSTIWLKPFYSWTI